MTPRDTNLAEKMHEAFRLSLRFDYSEGFTEAEYDMVSGWADGLCHKYYEKHESGACSLQSAIDFDLAKWERIVDADTKAMRAMLATVTR